MAAPPAPHASRSPRGNLLGADILLRRALALGAEDKATLDLYRTVGFLLEDAPFKLP
ncbi:MAG: hypothetical protein Q8L48_36195 [Archangium sp.]|nr:hypothetical protein [Archangium sp.]